MQSLRNQRTIEDIKGFRSISPGRSEETKVHTLNKQLYPEYFKVMANTYDGVYSSPIRSQPQQEETLVDCGPLPLSPTIVPSNSGVVECGDTLSGTTKILHVSVPRETSVDNLLITQGYSQ